jgi:hypothetical protein
MFSKQTVVSTTYTVTEHNPNLFSVRSHVLTKDVLGGKRTFTNFVGEAKTRQKAEELVAIVKGQTQ